MHTFFIIASALLGAIIGSFINVVVVRHGTGMGLNGRSRCFSCGTQLTWVDLVPLLSFVVLSAQCRTCHTRISWQYPLVEATAALLFGLIAWQSFPNSFSFGTEFLYSSVPLFLCGLFFWSVLLAIVVYDLRHTVIPDSFSLALAGVGFGALLLRHVGMPYTTYLPDIATGIFLAGCFLFLWIITQGRGMGLGDAKLAVGLGWFLGARGAIDVLFFSFWIGAAVGLVLLGFQKLFAGSNNALLGGRQRVTMKSEIPFAPFLAVAAVLVWFMHLSVPFF